MLLQSCSEQSFISCSLSLFFLTALVFVCLFLNFYWSIVDLQCCVSFRGTAKVNQLYIYIYPLFFRFSSQVGHYRVLSRVPCAIQQVLISYIFYIQQCVCVNTNLLIYPSPSLHPGNHKFIFYICNSISVLQISSFVPFFFDSTYK